MLIIALCLVVYVAAIGAETVRDALRSLPRSNDDWVWF
ncbi:hypothetical protein ABIC94_000467 [Variovorax paradoxus]